MPRPIPGDWHSGGIPDNAVVHETAVVETAMCFDQYKSELPVGLELGMASGIYTGTTLSVGPRGLLRLGAYSMLTSVSIVCDELIDIGSHCLISWNVIIMDSYRTNLDPASRRRALTNAPGNGGRAINEAGVQPRPVKIGNNVWLGFDVCILPGVTIGEGSIIGARSVVNQAIPPYVVAAGNPARIVKQLEQHF